MQTLIFPASAPPGVERIAQALGSYPTAAYTAPHIYPQAVPMFTNSRAVARERVHPDSMRLYVHIPFCNYHCSYCCYAKRIGIDEATMGRYIQALIKELEFADEGTPLSQLFMGGGTPTALPASLLDEILRAINLRMPSTGSGVHTVEASPDSISDEHLEVLKTRGVGRISMGVQSLQDEVLTAVTRKHNHQTVLDSCKRIMDAGFILNIDLIYGLPRQSEEDYFGDFETAAEEGVHSVTVQNLRINDRTAIQRMLAEDEIFNLHRLIRWREFVRQTSQQFGYSQTRWHTFKKLDTVAAKHKRLPTFDADLHGNQLGIGMSARSSLGQTVYRNVDKLTTYMERIESGESPTDEYIALNGGDLKTLFIIRTLGDGSGLDFAEYSNTFHSEFMPDYPEVVSKLLGAKLLAINTAGVELTETGKNVYDLITLAFYPAHAKRWLRENLLDFHLELASSS